jgi:hypothetical protein
MAVSKVHGAQRDAAIAGVDLSNSLFRFCVKNASKEVVLSGAGAEVVGVIYETAPLGRPATFAMAGTGTIVKVEAGAAVAVNAKVMSNASGQAVTATAGNAAVGIARSSAAAAGDIIELYFNNVTDVA